MSSVAPAPTTQAAKPGSQGLILPAAMICLAVVLYYVIQPATYFPGFGLSQFSILALILFTAGFMSGLTGFAFSAIGALTLFLLPPITAVPLLQALSSANQMLSVGKLRKDMPKKWKEWWPYGAGPAILGGLFGVQSGVWLLHHLPGKTIMMIFGVLVTVYAVYSLFKPASLKVKGFSGAPTGIVLGAFGGAIGGFTAFPGLPIVIWTGLRDLGKATARAIVQPFILTLQILSLTTNGIQHPNNFGLPFWAVLAIAIPVVLPGTLFGVWLYHRVSDLEFKRACFFLLGIAGIGLLVKALAL